jgi:hypothetical protein
VISVRDRFATIGRGILWLFLKIAEPRVQRIVQLGIYLVFAVLGGIFLADPPRSYEGVLGDVLAFVFGVAITAGGVIGAVAVLPGRWWAERLAIIALWTGLGMYIVVALSLAASPVGIGVAVCLALALLNRWLLVRGAQIEPGR